MNRGPRSVQELEPLGGGPDRAMTVVSVAAGNVWAGHHEDDLRAGRTRVRQRRRASDAALMCPQLIQICI
jgi:hypothetical protein